MDQEMLDMFQLVIEKINDIQTEQKSMKQEISNMKEEIGGIKQELREMNQRQAVFEH